MDLNTITTRIKASTRINPMRTVTKTGAGFNKEGQAINENYQEPIYRPADLKPMAVLCADGPFAVCELENGKFATWQPGHVTVFENREELLDGLNFHERQLLALGINR